MSTFVFLCQLFTLGCLAQVCCGDLAGRFGVRSCRDFLDCSEGECCVKGDSPFGKRGIFDDLWGAVKEVFNPSNKTANATDTGDDSVIAPPDLASNTTTSKPSGGVDVSKILSGLAGGIDLNNILGGMDVGTAMDILRALNGIPSNRPTTPDPRWEETIKALSDSSQIQSFLDHHSKTRNRDGTCRKLGVAGDICVNHLDGHTCPCSEGYRCREDADFKFGGFGAISGFHNLRCGEA